MFRFSSYVSDDTFIDVCSNRTVYGKALNLILNGSQPTVHSGFKNSNLCACVISTSNCDSGARLRFQAVDVRLHQNQDITKCHPHSLFDITDGEYNSRPRSYKCQENHFYKDFIDLYYSRKPYARISLYNNPELNISQLWLRVTGIQCINENYIMAFNLILYRSLYYLHIQSNLCLITITSFQQIKTALRSYLISPVLSLFFDPQLKDHLCHQVNFIFDPKGDFYIQMSLYMYCRVIIVNNIENYMSDVLCEQMFYM